MHVAPREAGSSRMVSKERQLAERKYCFTTILPIQQEGPRMLDDADVEEEEVMSLKKNSNGNGHNGSNGDGHFKLIDMHEKDTDRRTAVSCTIYLMLMLALFGWLLFDTWIGNHSLARILGYDRTLLNNTDFRVVAFTIIAGGLGGAVDGIRSTMNYCDSFNRRHRWKYICLPWMGSTLALFVYALLRSSMAVLGGNVSSGNIGNTQVLANFTAGALAGFGSKDVFIWLDDKVHKIFQVTEKVPNVKGKSQEVAVSRLHAASLELGQVSRVQQSNGKPAGTVMDQSPPPDAPIDRGQSVDIAVAGNGKAN
jgi:PASTA domain-containing protein